MKAMHHSGAGSRLKVTQRGQVIPVRISWGGGDFQGDSPAKNRGSSYGGGGEGKREDEEEMERGKGRDGRRKGERNEGM